MNTSPNRGTFQIECQIKSVEEGRKTAEQAEDMIDFYKSWEQLRREQEETAEWKIDNMEYDLRSTKWICDKAKEREEYAQNLYAAMCNNEFQKLEEWPILTDKRWSCSWRYAGGIVADMREQGDYIDWYCSGIKFHPEDVKDNETLSEEQIKLNKLYEKYVGESVVTDEIRKDLLKLGWIVVDGDNLV